MSNMKVILLTLLYMISCMAWANDKSGYLPARVVYDLASRHTEEITNILDRASMLQNVYSNDPFESSIIIVIHEQAIPFFVSDKKSKHRAIEQRAASLVTAEIIQFRICRASAKMQGLTAKDFNSYIKLVPMADAEIIRLQNEGYAYLK